MEQSGFWWIGLALFVLAIFPLFVYAFFSLVVLERKSQGLVDDLKHSKAFEMSSIREQLGDEDAVKSTMRTRYGYKRFLWPVLLLIFFNVIGFSIVWDILGFKFGMEGSTSPLLYSEKFLHATELPMMAFLGVVVFNYGNMVRRLYVWDVTTPVFWNALYRTWLVLAAASVLGPSAAFLPQMKSDAGGQWFGLYAVFFMVGFIINEVVAMMMALARKRLQIKRLEVVELPLSLIQGINFWHEYRLEEEGVENVQNLATCDIIDLAFATRYNLRTLLDWVDQAILVHRMGEKAKKLRDEGFISGAIDMAWASPANANGDQKLPELIAKTVGSETLFVSALMNGLFQDAQIRLLWNLWQSDLDAPAKDKPTTALPEEKAA
jgi:hypothetical protein